MNLEKEIFEISLTDIIPNRFQPREMFDDASLQELAQSIREHGVIQPIIVRKVGDKYEIIAGERRFRASQLAGKETIPALVRDIDDRETAKIALLENLQRSNLTPIEEAKTYQTILKLDNITQEELAQNLGKSQSTIANKLRLLTLAEEVQTALLNSEISERHARSLLSLDTQMQTDLLKRIINEKLTVRQLDEEIMKLTGKMPEVIETPEETENKNSNLNMNENNNPVIAPTISQGSAEENINKQEQVANIPSKPENNLLPNIDEQKSNQSIENSVQPVVTPQNSQSLDANRAEEKPVENKNVEVNNSNEPLNNISPMNNNLNKLEQTQENVQNNVTIPESNVNESTNINEESQSLPNETNIPEENAPESEANNQEEQNKPEINDSQNIEESANEIIQIPSIEKTEEPKQVSKPTNIFDQFRVPSDEKEEPEEKQEQFNDVYDLRFAINNFRQAIQNTEKFGFKVTSNEYDSENKYQIVIEIDKKN